ncbi:CD3324 family protein [Anaerosalibacter massiliensis]|uniref:CD3324 family protein n=1 Tax=Anaerosalibacter massiliensis TaxID=1347392 RepID=A0A9X2S6D2_9FIRM|nr:CD3324 family protein [Anaerosalibacter massiliensis]MCR2042916.1 CD3324 family protein [Anaerosalibacter massiliensis]
MSYKRAEHILPAEIIELIQNYVDGESIYIPRKDNNRREWGERTNIRNELDTRNQQIYDDYQQGYEIIELVKKYFLSEKSIQCIILKMKKTV